jgi:uncharacterized OB-fold protein
MTSIEYAKLLPEDIPQWQMPFWDSVRDNKAAVQRCDDCGTFRFVPKERCGKCLSGASTWTPIAGSGDLYTYTIVHRAPTPAYQEDVPYVIGHVTMTEGFRMVSNVRGIAPGEVRIGMPVHLDYEEATPDWTLYSFEPS